MPVAEPPFAPGASACAELYTDETCVERIVA
jgi:hypothetical protein